MSKKTLIGLAAGAMLVGAYFVTVVTLGAEIGETCDKEWGCKGTDAVCLEGDAPMCSRSCETESDCPTDWMCHDVQVLTFDGKSSDPEESARLVCLPKS